MSKCIPKDSIFSMFLAGFFMVWLGIPVGSLLIMVMGFVFMGSAIAIWCWKIMTF